MARARAGHKYPLLVYQHIVNRWWPALIMLGLEMFALAYLEYIGPMGYFLPWRWQILGGVGVLCILVALFFLVLRYLAYIQPYSTYLKVVTPFLRFNISYKRIQKTTSTEMCYLFPPKSLSWWMEEILAPLAGKTALVLELNGYPLSPFLLRRFLSRFFFKDKTPHIVILVKDWLRFSSELDSMRTGWDVPASTPRKRARDSILSRLPRD